MQWLPVTTWQYRFQSDETMDAIARGEVVGLFTGKPTGRISWGNRRFGQSSRRGRGN